MTIKLACLDMAGTTVRDDGLVQQAFLSALEAVGITAEDPELDAHLDHVQRSMGQAKIDVFRHLLHDEGRAHAAARAFEVAVAEAVRSGSVAPLDGALEAIEAIRATGTLVCLTTGFSPETQQIIVSHLGWLGHLDLLLAPGGGLRGRPHPDLVLAAILRLGIDDVREVAVAGDTANDLLAGWRAGASVVAGVLTGAHGRAELEAAPHTHVLDSIVELPAILRA